MKTERPDNKMASLSDKLAYAYQNARPRYAIDEVTNESETCLFIKICWLYIDFRNTINYLHKFKKQAPVHQN